MPPAAAREKEKLGTLRGGAPQTPAGDFAPCTPFKFALLGGHLRSRQEDCVPLLPVPQTGSPCSTVTRIFKLFLAKGTGLYGKNERSDYGRATT